MVRNEWREMRTPWVIPRTASYIAVPLPTLLSSRLLSWFCLSNTCRWLSCTLFSRHSVGWIHRGFCSPCFGFYRPLISVHRCCWPGLTLKWPAVTFQDHDCLQVDASHMQLTRPCVYRIFILWEQDTVSTRLSACKVNFNHSCKTGRGKSTTTVTTEKWALDTTQESDLF